MRFGSSATLAACIFLIALCGATAAFAAQPLFPVPLHLTRTVGNPLSGSTTTVEEYCVGNRIIAIHGDRTSIADYATSELLEINRGRGTYSITRFDELAKAWSRDGGARIAKPKSSSGERPGSSIRSLGSAIVAGRRVDRFESEVDGAGKAKAKVTIGVDSSITLSLDALEAIVGASWPHSRRPVDDAVIAMSGESGGGVGAQSTSKSTASSTLYRLPLDETITYDVDGEAVEVKNRITRVGHELPPADLLAIPTGATRVESSIVRSKKMLDDLDRLPTAQPNRN